MLVFLCMCVFMCMHTCRMDNNLPERSVATGNALVDSNNQHQVLEDDHTYSSVDDLQQQTFMVSDNPVYNASLLPLQDDDHAYSNTKFSQEQESVTHSAAAWRKAGSSN